ncbi:MAG: MFS transporter [Deltaproteobacteria bacterium]|nr:MFS transporter [Deltaproteobacteria bacterium]
MTEPALQRPTAKGARRALLALTLLNLLNYVDRYVPSAVKDLFKADLHLDDAQTSWPLTAFVVVYMLASPVFGSLADRFARRKVIAFGVALWSVATAAAALAQGFWSFLSARALVGVGEAAYATLSPGLIADFYPPERRNKALTWFYVAIPVGAAVGFAAGGALGQLWGWRAAFVAVGLPGLLAAVWVWFLREPPRRHDPGEAPPDWPEALRLLRANRPYVYAVGGYVAVTFASGALADWYPTFLARHRGFDLAEAGSIVGAGTVLGGLGGTLAGGYLGDWLAGRVKHPYFLLSAATMAAAAALACLALQVHGAAAVTLVIVAAQFCMWCYNGPINALIVNSVPARLCARAFALSILAIHLFGDAISPPIVGVLADSGLGLATAMWMVPATLLLGAAIWGVGWRKL